jgi:hypothetical protein
MASLKNVRHEKFAQCVASGLSGADAYRQAAEYSGKQADGNAANWMKRPGVRECIEELKAESAARCSLSREAYIKSLAERGNHASDPGVLGIISAPITASLFYMGISGPAPGQLGFRAPVDAVTKRGCRQDRFHLLG